MNSYKNGYTFEFIITPTMKGRINELSMNKAICQADVVRLLIENSPEYMDNTCQNQELVWLYTHCSAIGMNKKSDSGKLEHDIALFTADLQTEKDKALRLLKCALADFYEEGEGWVDEASKLLGRAASKSRGQLMEEIRVKENKIFQLEKSLVEQKQIMEDLKFNTVVYTEEELIRVGSDELKSDELNDPNLFLCNKRITEEKPIEAIKHLLYWAMKMQQYCGPIKKDF